MGILDIVFLAILFIAFISGMQKGLITSALACVAMLGAFFIAKGLEGQLASQFEGTAFSNWLEQNFEVTTQFNWNNWFHVLSFVIVFVIAYAALMLLVNLLNNVIRMPKLKGADALLGGIFGLLRGYVVIGIIVFAGEIFFRPLEVTPTEAEEGNFALKLINDSALGKFFYQKSFGDLLGLKDLFNGLK